MALPILAAAGPAAMGAAGTAGAAGGGFMSSLMSPMVLSSLIGGGMSMGGGLLSGMFGQSSAEEAMDFQKEFAQNKFRWMVKDMRKAGLNPMLAAGASPGGLSGGFTAQMPNIGAEAGEIFADIPERILRYSGKGSQNEILRNQAITAGHERKAAFYNAATAEELFHQENKRTALFDKYGDAERLADIESQVAGALDSRASAELKHATARSASVAADVDEFLGVPGSLGARALGSIVSGASDVVGARSRAAAAAAERARKSNARNYRRR